ncbi:LysR substrate-binding domain-containing protein [Pandoraea sp.]|uniref:LysR substrate-binding domain-containing protein n=1 Tax=Pandoraea sp. TaxID=1883445 RepID=UPI0012223C0B|nr:LysR substrate-binding domain-containing protein [Pandoraea sp.]TAL55077.1 MAG: hypothetical protein EPN80_08905 [Pandoraea sp.]TAM19875.1 MAG: hypothetical protein EPN65_02305 [Pandoraea sp.]
MFIVLQMTVLVARRLAELAHARWILTGPAGGPGDPVQLGFESLGLQTPAVHLECESFSTLLGLMPTTDVVGIMPRGFFQRYGPRMGLVELPIEDPLPRISIHAVARADVRLTVPAQRLLDEFTHIAKESEFGAHE